jgi:hypothetical protein
MDKLSTMDRTGLPTAELRVLAGCEGLHTWRLGGRELIPGVQGGMGAVCSHSRPFLRLGRAG